MRGLSPAGAALRWGGGGKRADCARTGPSHCSFKSCASEPIWSLSQEPGQPHQQPGVSPSLLRTACLIKSRPSRYDLRLSLVLSPDPWLRQANPCSCCAHNTTVPTLCLWAVAQELQYGDSCHTAQVWLLAPSPVAPISGHSHLLPHVKTE